MRELVVVKTALVPFSAAPYLTVGDVLLLDLYAVPTEEERESIAWEFTGYPCFFATTPTEPTPSHVFRRQLREFMSGVTTAD